MISTFCLMAQPPGLPRLQRPPPGEFRPKRPPAQPQTGVEMPSSFMHPGGPQIGLNFIRFFWSEPGAPLNRSTPFLQPAAIFKDFRELGAGAYRQFVRADLLWDVVEPRDNEWNWEAADEVIRNPGCIPIVTLFRLKDASPTPPWASSPDEFQKRLGPEARDYLETVVKRYADFVKYWELGNEMDHWRAADPGSDAPKQERLPATCPRDGYSPKEQGAFLAEAAAVIRKFDPDAVIVMPGLSDLGDYCTKTWLGGVIEGGGRDWFDVVNYHYYPGWERYTLLRPALYKRLKELGLSDKPVWMTETGATASPTLTMRTAYPNSPETQAMDVFRRIVQGFGYGDSYVSWHTYISSPDVKGNQWRGYGIRTEHGEATPAWHAFRLLTSELLPFSRVERISSDAQGVNSYRFTTTRGTVRYVVWGEGRYQPPDDAHEMCGVVPDSGGKFDWQLVPRGTMISLSPQPVLFR